MFASACASAAAHRPLAWVSRDAHVNGHASHQAPCTSCTLASRRHSVATCATSRDAKMDLEQQDIAGLNRDYCDEFVCNSSPAVESTVRALARDITRANGVWTKSLLARSVEYQETFRRFKGLSGYRSLDFVPKQVRNAEVAVTSMRMAPPGNDTAVIAWRLRGSVGPLPVDVDMKTTIQMNLLTGQIERHAESWDLARCSPPAAVAWLLARAVWAAKAGTADAATAATSALDSLASMDNDAGDSGYTADPNDPTKFFQPPKDSFKEDAVFFLGAVALLYVVAQAYTTLFTS